MCAADGRLSALGGGIMAALSLGIARDSRSFARTLGVEHALVLRELQELEELGRILVTGRDARTQRCSYEARPRLAIVAGRGDV